MIEHEQILRTDPSNSIITQKSKKICKLIFLTVGVMHLMCLRHCR